MADDVTDLIRRFEALPTRQRIAQAPAAQAAVEALGLSESATRALWTDCFVPLLRAAERAQVARREAIEENPGQVVLKAAVELVHAHPRKLNRETVVGILVGSAEVGRGQELHGVAEGTSAEGVAGVLDQLVSKGILVEDARGGLERARRND